jgi:hypothetical protein
MQAVTESEMDIASRTIGNRNQRHSDVSDIVSFPVHHADPFPTYEALSPRHVVSFSDGQTDSSRESFMLLEGDTS